MKKHPRLARRSPRPSRRRPQTPATVGQAPETLAACFGRKNKKRTDQITAILATLKALGHIAYGRR